MLAKIKTILILILMGAVAYLLFQGSTFLDSKLENKPSPWVQTETDTLAPVSAQPLSTVADEADAVVKEARAHIAETQEESAPVSRGPLTFTVDIEQPEITNSNYRSLKSWADDDYPGIKDDIKAALANDGMVRNDEYMQIIRYSNQWTESQQSGAKRSLMDFIE